MTSLSISRPEDRSARVLAGSFALACLIEVLCIGGGVGWLLTASVPPQPAPMPVMTIENVAAPPKPVEAPPQPEQAPPLPVPPPLQPPPKQKPIAKAKPKPAPAPQTSQPVVQPLAAPSVANEPAAAAVAAPPVEQASPPPHAQAVAPQADQAFAAAVRQAVQSAVRYPAIARIKKQVGRAQVSFSYHDGAVSNIRVVVSSISSFLDQAAIEAVRNANYPEPPKEMAGSTQQYLIWVEFTNAAS